MYKNLKTPAVECLENGTYHCTGNFFLQTIFFKIDQLIADNPNSLKQTFNLFHITITSIATCWGGSQIKSIADQDCLAAYVGADFTEYRWRRCRTIIGENLSSQIAFCACLRLTLPAKKY